MAADYFLKITGVEGESGDDKHKGEVHVESWSFGATQTGSGHSGGGRGAGKVAMQDFHFVMNVNKASPKLAEACCKGSHFDAVTLTARKAGGKQEPYLTIKLEEVLVSSYQQGGSSGSEILPIDQVSLNYARISMDYKAQKPDGTLDGAVQFKWDLEKNV